MQDSREPSLSEDGDARVALDGALTIATARATQARLLAALRGARPVLLDCRAGTEFDVAFVQLLEAARAQAGRLGLAFHLAGPLPEGLRAVLAGGGFAPMPEMAAGAAP